MNAVELSLAALDQCDALFEDELMWPDVREAMRPTLQQSTASRDAIVTDEYAAAKFVISLVARYIEQQVALGEYHIYRGTLGGDGQSLRRIADEALSYLHEIEELSHDEYQLRREHLDQAVRNAG